MIVRRHAQREPRRLPFALALALGVLVALVVPALASAADFEVTGTGDETTTTACETGIGECTLRGAVAAANANANLDEITFAPAFDGGSGSTIALGSTLYVTKPVEILDTVGGGVPYATVHVSGTAFQISAAETVIEGLGIEASSIGVQILGGLGAKIRNNFISGSTATTPQAGVEVNGGNGSAGNLIEGNQIKVPGTSGWGIAIQFGANRIFGNEIAGGGEGGSYDGCCYQGIYIEMSGAGNQIGGDTPESENVITNFWYGAIWINTSNDNEIGRNRGTSTSTGFITTSNAIQPPTIAKAYPTTVSGTATPGAKVRVFAAANEGTGEIDGFLGEATANGSGEWSATITTSAVGAHVTATQTFEGSTSQLVGTTVVESESSSGGGGGGGGSSSGGGTTTTTTPPPTPAPITAPAPTKPTVKITSGPKKSSTTTTAKFKFKATNVSGATFECKLDHAKWANCKSPKTYKKLKPGKHTFQVRAKADGLTSAVAKFSFTVKR